MLQPPAAEAVILDLDGTFLDTAPDLMGAVNDLRAEQGLPALPAGQLMPVVSHGSAALIRRGFDLVDSDPRFELLRQALLDLYAARVSRETRPFPGVLELIEGLEDRGVPWGIVTNKPGWLTRPLLSNLGFRDRIACLVTGDCLPERKPSPEPILSGCRQIGIAPERCVAVGDAERDVQSARRAGTLTLVALYGYVNGEDQVRRWGADGLISHPLEVLRWVVEARARHPMPARHARSA